MKPNKIIDWLTEAAKINLDSAHGILGAKPGPGIDIEVVPTYPMGRSWTLTPLTKAGHAFVARFWMDPHIETNHRLLVFKRQAQDWGLKYRVVIKYEPLTEQRS